jgi:hypothetical protein
MVIVKDESYLIKTRIEVGQFFGREAAEAFIELREPNNKDLIRIKDGIGKSEAEALAAFSEIMPRIITDHNIYATEDQLKTSAEVAALIVERLGIYSYVVKRYAEDVVFSLGKGIEMPSDGLPEESSEAK